MTNKELQEELKKYPDDLTILVHVYSPERPNIGNGGNVVRVIQLTNTTLGLKAPCTFG